jgi:hypothetical protein
VKLRHNKLAPLLLVLLSFVAAYSVMCARAYAKPCGSRVTCNTGDDGSVTATESPSPTPGTSAQPVVDSGSKPVESWTDCGEKIGDQVRTATDVGACFEPLQACPLPRGQKGDANIHVFLVVTTYADGATKNRNLCDVDVRAHQPQLSPAEVEKWLRKRIPVGSIGTPNPMSLVNLKTIFWMNVKPSYEWGPLTLMQANVRIRVALDRVHWSFGDGVEADASDAGKPYEPAEPCDAQCVDHYGHAYTTKKGPMRVDATTFWKAEFSVNGGAFVALTKPVRANPAPAIQVAIVEARSQLVANPNG